MRHLHSETHLRPSNKEKPYFKQNIAYLFGSRKCSNQLYAFRSHLLASSGSRFHPLIFLQEHHRKEASEDAIIEAIKESTKLADHDALTKSYHLLFKKNDA